jgi:hypothetical protein
VRSIIIQSGLHLTLHLHRVSSLLWGERGKNETGEVEATAQPAAKQADINVFTVASGHLYEVRSSLIVSS